MKANEGWTVELEAGVWLAPWKGDPGRTLVGDSAKGFGTRHGARAALGQARRHRPFARAEIHPPTAGRLGRALDRLVRAGLVDRDGNTAPFYAPGNEDHMPHAFGSRNPDTASG